MTARTSERRIANMREVLNLLVQNHGETRERLIRIEDKVDVLVDDLAETRGDVGTLKNDVAVIKRDVTAIMERLDQMSRPR